MGLFDKEKAMVNRLVQESAQAIARAAYIKIVMPSPIWSGTYVRSHRIGIGHEDSEGPTIMPEPDWKIGSAFSRYAVVPIIDEEGHRAAAMLRIITIEQANAFQNIVLSNDCDHAIDVEYLGTKRQPTGWHIYRLATDDVESRAKGIINRIATKVAK